MMVLLTVGAEARLAASQAEDCTRKQLWREAGVMTLQYLSASTAAPTAAAAAAVAAIASAFNPLPSAVNVLLANEATG